MRTAGSVTDPSNERVSRPSSEENAKLFFRQGESEKITSEDMNGIERRLKALWSEYVEYQDKYGLDDKAKVLKEKYFSLYQSYRRNKNWKHIVSNNK